MIKPLKDRLIEARTPQNRYIILLLLLHIKYGKTACEIDNILEQCMSDESAYTPDEWKQLEGMNAIVTAYIGDEMKEQGEI